jgi:riboflavin transporter FmnP
MVKFHTGSEYFRNRIILILKNKSANLQTEGRTGENPVPTVKVRMGKEKNMSRLTSSNKLRRIVLVAVFGALAYALMLVIHFKVSFLTLDLKDAVITLSGLYFGPGAALSLSLLVPLLELISVSDTGIYGFLMNFISTATLSVTASLIYRYKRSLLGAIIALLSAAAATVGVMMLFNLWVTPYYMGVPVQTVKSMIPTLLLPFNTVKSCMNVGFVLLLYKPISAVMQRMKLIEKHSQQQKIDWKTIAVAVLALTLIAVSLGIVFGVLGGSFEWR